MNIDSTSFQGMGGHIISQPINLIHRIFNDKKIRYPFTRLTYPIFLVIFIVFIRKIKPDLFLSAIGVSLFG